MYDGADKPLAYDAETIASVMLGLMQSKMKGLPEDQKKPLMVRIPDEQEETRT